MAKQTFTTGQVLTAAQMTSLQQTAMGGGSATAKTASYVLVAADAGTTVAMNAAGATTITVNTGLFAAGDTVFIQNLGAGACTVTAGTATVATAGSLILPQNDAGILYFTATGASIFYDFIQAGAVSPLTTKGDLYTFSTSDARLGVGANNTFLRANSATATGLEYADAYTSYTPTITGVTQGNGTITGKSMRVGKMCHAEVVLVFGSTTVMVGPVGISLPFTSTTSVQNPASATLLDTGTAVMPALAFADGTGSYRITAIDTSGANATERAITSIVPFTWATGDRINFSVIYEVA